MQQFNLNYPSDCPVAVLAERTLNTCASDNVHLQELRGALTKTVLEKFLIACLLYWAEAKYWDERNRLAVLISKRIVEHFPQLAKTDIDETTMKEAYGFTSCAHRHLQYLLFCAFRKSLEENDPLGIREWLQEQQFVIADDGKSVIPYTEYKLSHC